jgi:hypothetical protein
MTALAKIPGLLTDRPGHPGPAGARPSPRRSDDPVRMGPGHAVSGIDVGRLVWFTVSECHPGQRRCLSAGRIGQAAPLWRMALADRTACQWSN